MKKQRIATLVLAAIVVSLVWFGVDTLSELQANHHHGHNHSHDESHGAKYLGISLILLALVIAWFHQWLVTKMVRFSTIMLVALALVIEPMLHTFGIPHPEGLWIPLLEGGAVLTALANYWQRIREVINSWFRSMRDRL